ncbi:MAG: helix-turn-helix transcriptional regulator [Clostridium sp.]
MAAKKSNKDKMVEILISYVRHYRVRVNMTQRDVGRYIGITEQRFASIEKNKHKTNILKCIKMAECLSTKVDELYKIVKISEDQYNKIKCFDLSGEYSKELKEAHETLDKNKGGQMHISKEELDKLRSLIYKNSILRYGNVIESAQWEKIKNKI